MSLPKPALKPAPSQMVTGHELWSGQPVFFCADGSWTSNAAEAALSSSAEESIDLLARAEESNKRAEVELVALIAAEKRSDGRCWPARNREIIRAEGPTVRRDLGYQAAGHEGP